MVCLSFKMDLMCKLSFLLMCFQFIRCRKNLIVKTENCTLKPVSRTLVGELDKLITSDNRLIALNITIEWNTPTLDELHPLHMKWFMTTSVSGQRLLPDHFSEMSLWTLSYGYEHLQVILQQKPEDCLENLSNNDIENILKHVLLKLPNNSIQTEDGARHLHVCNGSIKSNGYCCNLSLTGNNLTCSTLKDDPWMKPLKYIFGILTTIFLLQSVSFIPKHIYEKSKKEIFTLSDTSINMKLKVTDRFIPSKGNKWDEISLSSNKFLIDFRKKLNGPLTQPELGNTNNKTFTIRVKTKTVIADKDQLHSETFSSSDIFDFLYVSYKDVLRSCKSNGRCFWSFFDKMTLFLFLIVLCVPFILRVLFLLKYESYYETDDDDLVRVLSGLIMVLPLCSVLCAMKIECIMKRSNIAWKRLLKKSLRITFETESISEKKYRGYPVSSVINLIIHVKAYFPSLQFLFLVSSQVLQRNKFAFSLWTFSVSNGIVGLSVLVVDCVLFYVECVFCTMLGLLLNYNKVFQYVLLLLMIVKYAYDCIRDVQNMTSKLAIRIFKVIRELSKDSQNIQSNSVSLLQGNEERQNRSRFVRCEYGTVCWLPKGLSVFYILTKPENLYFMHVSRNFIDYISALPGRLTPGSKYSLLCSSCKEVFSVIVLLFLVLYFVLGFGQENDLSSSVLTIVTFVSGAVSSVLARLWFKPKKYSDSNNDVHLSQLIKTHLYKYEEPWIIEDFDVISCERNTESDVNEDDTDIVVERLTSEQEVWYVKPLVKGNSFDSMAAKTQLKRMFIIPSSNNEVENNSTARLASSHVHETDTSSRSLAFSPERDADSHRAQYGSIQNLI